MAKSLAEMDPIRPLLLENEDGMIDCLFDLE